MLLTSAYGKNLTHNAILLPRNEILQWNFLNPAKLIKSWYIMFTGMLFSLPWNLGTSTINYNKYVYEQSLNKLQKLWVNKIWNYLLISRADQNKFYY